MNSLIGNTPMIKIKYKYKNKVNTVFVKLEYYNITGSVKDRLALYIINKSKEIGILKEHMPIIEATSGNTGISFSALGAQDKHPVYVFMPNWVSKERISLMKLYGANVKLISKEEGGFEKCIELTKSLAQEINGFIPNQFANPLNTECHYETTGKEIINQLGSINIGGFVSGIGSGGTIMGIGKRLKEFNHNTKICAVEPDKMPLLTNKEIIGNHKIEGIGDDFIPELVDKKIIDYVFDINDSDAINMSKKLGEKLGLGVGISSGANFIGSILLQDKINDSVVTLFPDDNKKYLSTDLSNQINIEDNFISDKVELLEYSLLT